MLTDATSRNALYKIHVSLGKIVNALDHENTANATRQSRSVSVALTDKTVLSESDKTVVPEDTKVKIEERSDEDENQDSDATMVKREDVVNELLSDEDGDTAMQDA